MFLSSKKKKLAQKQRNKSVVFTQKFTSGRCKSSGIVHRQINKVLAATIQRVSQEHSIKFTRIFSGIQSI